MWPFADSNSNVITIHEQTGYVIDVLFVVAVVVAVIYWRWRRNARRIKELEATRRIRQNA